MAPGGYESPAVAVINNAPHFFWSENVEGLFHVYYRTLDLAPSDALSAVGQSLTISSGLVRPTLAFAYRLYGALPGQTDSLALALTDQAIGQQQVIASIARVAPVWQHAWIDVEAWAGKTVTLTISASARAGSPLVLAELDDVTLGSWITPTTKTVYLPKVRR